MKKYIYIAAAFAALLSCSKSEQPNNEISGTGFQKGQQVTLHVTAGEHSTRVSSALNADGEKIDFKWEDGDKIKVTVNGQSEVFKLSSGAGTNDATFTGTMPASCDEFDVQYPYDGVEESALAIQTYTEGEALPKNLMLFSKSGCTGTSFELEPKFAALRLNLYGGARSVSQIVVTNTGTSDTYTLTCSPAKVVGKDKDHATPFFVVVPEGTGSWNFSAAVTASEVASTTENTASYESYGLGTIFSLASTTFSPANAQSFTAGGVLNMPAKSLTTVWAPVNCGYDSTHTYGLLYQWGRKYGQAYETGTISPETLTKDEGEDSANKDKFGKYNTTNYNWFSGVVDNTLWNGSSKGTYDPCPEGWRVPTKIELNTLRGNNLEGWTEDVGGQNGYYFNGTSSCTSTTAGAKVFLPAAGYRLYFFDGNASYRDSNGYYWSSSVTGLNAWSLNFNDVDAYFTYVRRADGRSVRCVQE